VAFQLHFLLLLLVASFTPWQVDAQNLARHRHEMAQASKSGGVPTSARAQRPSMDKKASRSRPSSGKSVRR